jgi:4-hydroxybenzoate polyprenyltransferase
MTRRLLLFVCVAAIPALILMLFIHIPWLRFLSLGLLLLALSLAYFTTPPTRSNHVLDNLVTLAIASILVVAGALACQWAHDKALPNHPPSTPTRPSPLPSPPNPAAPPSPPRPFS